MQKYSDELQRQIINDYKEGVFGYKKLAEKYGLTRDAIRGIILRHYKFKKQDELVNMKKEDIILEDYELENYKTALAYWKTYAKTLEEHINETKKNKKKFKSAQSRN